MFKSRSGESLISAISKVGDWEIGDRCRIDNRSGSIAFIGSTQFAPGEWIGLFLDEPLGRNDGSVDGHRYFSCPEKHGIFCKASKLERILMDTPSSPAETPQSPNPFSKEFGLEIDDRVVVSGGKRGTLRFLGFTDFQEGVWAGIELDQPLGKNDGSVQGKRYFTCKAPYGLFSSALKITKVPNQSPTKIKIRHTKTSALRQRLGSQESLSSIGASSIASSRLSKFSFAIPKRPIVISSSREHEEMLTTLKESLKEKDKHLEQLLKERDLERNEMAELSKKIETKNSEAALDISKTIDDSKQMKTYIKTINMKISELERENQEIRQVIKEKEEKVEELSFLFEEKTINNVELSEKIAELGSEMKAKLEEIARLKNELTKVAEENEKRVDDVGKFKNDQEMVVEIKKQLLLTEKQLEESRSKIDEFENLLKEKAESEKQMQETFQLENETKKEFIESLEKKISELMNQIVESNKSAEEYEKSQNEKVMDLEARLSAAMEKATFCEQQVSEFNELKARKTELEDRIVLLETDLVLTEKTKENDLKNLKQLIDDITLKNDNLNSQLITLETKNRISEEQDNKFVKLDLSEMNLMKQKLDEYEGVKKHNEYLRDECENHKRERIEMENALLDATKKVEELSNDSELLKERNKDFEEKIIIINDLHSSKNDLLKRLSTLENEMKILNVDKVNEALNFEKRIDEISQSNSDLSSQISTQEGIIKEKDAEIASLNSSKKILSEQKLDEYEELKKQNERLRDECEKYKKENIEIERELNIISKTIEDLRQDKELMRERNKDLEERIIAINDLNSNKNDFLKQLNKLENEMRILKEKKVEQASQLEARIKELSESNSHLRTLISTQDDNVREKDNQICGLKNCVAELEERLKTFENEHEAMQNAKIIEITGFENQISKLTQEISEYEKKLASILEAKMAKEEEVSSIKDKLLQLTNEINKRNFERERFLSDLNSASTEMAKSLANIERISDRSVKLENQVHQLSTVTKEFAFSLGQQRKSFNASLQKEKMKNSNLENEKSSMKEEIEALRNFKENNGILEIRSEQLTDENSHLKEVITKLESDLSFNQEETRKKFDHEIKVEKDLESKQTENELLKMKISSLQKEIDSMESVNMYEQELIELKSQLKASEEQNENLMKQNQKLEIVVEELNNKEETIFSKPFNAESGGDITASSQDIHPEMLLLQKNIETSFKGTKEDSTVEVQSKDEKCESELTNVIDENEKLKIEIEKISNERSCLKQEVLSLKGMQIENEMIVAEAKQKIAVLAEVEDEWKAKRVKYKKVIAELKIRASKSDNETIIDLRDQVNFLNSVIAVQQQKGNELKAEIEILNQTPADKIKSALHKKISDQALRLYCDICEEFDLHDTTDCPKQASELTEYDSHSHYAKAKGSNYRPYCDYCEAFLHETSECPSHKTDDYTF